MIKERKKELLQLIEGYREACFELFYAEEGGRVARECEELERDKAAAWGRIVDLLDKL